MPRVSVITPSYNGAAHIAATIDSVLAQTLTDWEMVIVDDCSTDDTRAVLASYTDPRIRVIALPENLGPVGARNRAFAAARGRYVAGLDQDDLCHPDRFAFQAAFLDAHPGTVLVASDVALIGEGASQTSPFLAGLSPALIDWLMLLRNPFAWSSVMFRADAARRLDPFERPELRYAEDFDVYQRLRAYGELAQIDAPLRSERCHAGGAAKRFPERMAQSARQILMEAHARLLGSASAEDADLLLRHVMAREAVPDVATLGQLFDLIGRLYPAFARARPCGEIELQAIDSQIERLRWDVCRAAIRSGALPLKLAIDTMPRELTEGLGNRAELMVSGLIGKARALRGG